MSQTVLDVTMSVDGYIAAPGGDLQRLHDWVFDEHSDRVGQAPHTHVSGVNADVMRRAYASTGAVVMGRRTFDMGEGPWGEAPPFHTPCFVLTHTDRDPIVKGAASFSFVTDGIEHAITEARRSAGGRDVIVLGADTAQQSLRADLLDAVILHLVPVVLGGGTRLFDTLETGPVELEQTEIVSAPDVTHLYYRVLR